jgi:hypothetical protein
MSEQPDVGDACVRHLRAKKFLMSALSEFGREICSANGGDKSSGSSPAAKRDGLGFPDL